MNRKISMKIMLISAMAAALVISSCDKKDSTPQTAAGRETANARAVSVAAVEVREYKPIVESTGSLVPERHATVAALVDGKVDRIPVDIGTKVKKGGMLFQIRKTDYRNGYDQAVAGNARAETLAALREQEKDRTAALFEKGAVSAEINDQAIAAHRDAQAQLRQTKAAQNSARQFLRDSSVFAPYDCVVTVKYLQQGEFARKGNPVVEIMDLRVLEAELELPERYAGSLTLDLPVTLDCRSQSEAVTGKVVAVNPKIDMANRTFTVKVSVENAEEKLQAGLFCSAQFQLPAEAGQMAVPREAIIRDEGRSSVWVVENGKAYKKIVVENGTFEDGWVRITEGLKPGDQVITEGGGGLGEGNEVRVK